MTGDDVQANGRQMLVGADLRGADLTGADLQAARLDGADLTGACLVRADLAGASLTGVRGLAEAELRDANLAGATGLTADDLAGADLTGVTLPDHLAGFDRLHHLSGVIGIARPLYLFVLVVTAFILLTVFSTPDVALFTNAPSAVMPNLSTAIPAASLFWIAPLILVFLYAYLHFYMTRMWDDLAGLPRVFPDGSAVEVRAHPWLLVELVKLRDPGHKVGFREALVIFLLWGAVPATLLGIWWRYLPLRDWPVTAAHIVIVLVAVWGAMTLFGRAVSRLRGGPWEVPGQRRRIRLLAILMLVVSGLLLGLPWGLDRIGRVDTASADTATPEVPGVKPKNVRWLTADLEDGDLTGVAMTGSDLRYAYGHRARLAGVNLKDSNLAGSDFQRADFTEALLEDADLSHSNLDSGTFRNACLRRANLARSDLEDSDFTGAYLGRADLTLAYFGRVRMAYANLQGAILDGADLSGADLRGAVFNCYASHQHDPDRAPRIDCASLDGTDFTDADLAGAQFLGTDLTRVGKLLPEQLREACGINVRLPSELEGALRACGPDANRGIAPGALAGDSPVDPEANPCWHEMRSDFSLGPATRQSGSN